MTVVDRLFGVEAGLVGDTLMELNGVALNNLFNVDVGDVGGEGCAVI